MWKLSVKWYFRMICEYELWKWSMKMMHDLATLSWRHITGTIPISLSNSNLPQSQCCTPALWRLLDNIFIVQWLTDLLQSARDHHHGLMLLQLQQLLSEVSFSVFLNLYHWCEGAWSGYKENPCQPEVFTLFISKFVWHESGILAFRQTCSDWQLLQPPGVCVWWTAFFLVQCACAMNYDDFCAKLWRKWDCCETLFQIK